MEEEHARMIEDKNNYNEFQEVKEQREGIAMVEEKQEEEEEEALSLCDMPLNQNSRSASKCNSMDDASFTKILRRSPPSSSSMTDTTELFEFFSGFSSSSSSDMCPADDIIFCGKLVPFKNRQGPTQNHMRNQDVVETKKPPLRRRRSESLSSVVTRSNSVTTGSRRFMMRNSRSLDYRRLHEHSSSAISQVPEVDRNLSSRSVAEVATAKKAMKPRWYSLVFGTMRVPPEMELSDMKNRQVRRNSSGTMFPAMDSGAANRSSGKVSWKILKALSCKDHSSVAVTTSFALPQAS
ncbi:hypothetical protein HN51_002159 [Arachis hypogaea]|uniref:Uncharacterized protein n=3 Tax=Arachis TaxID=3817 RepID=A0A445ENJ8_ARAHY|nr:uncharacterized protein LOC107461232 [Arachis duranensis]XP_025655370.1 uncharacterized protein LOC112750725 [Arachis hypogaea]QHO50325.1 uncharacterized protein DS421_1g21610 [Arachis hypogaea]RYR77030.1 hypothetical protein Ahy_A01g001513 isoform C [Arachis hypogaea]